jgi:hypothetical protein
MSRQTPGAAQRRGRRVAEVKAPVIIKRAMSSQAEVGTKIDRYRGENGSQNAS